MDTGMIINKLTELIKKYRFVILILMIGIVFMMIPSKEEQTESPQKESTVDSVKSPEEKLAEILSYVRGAGRVEVMLTIASGAETIYETNREESLDQIKIETVIVSGQDRSEEGLIRQINPVTYRGAIVVCQGADDPHVKLAIVEAVSKITGLGTDHISVIKMK